MSEQDDSSLPSSNSQLIQPAMAASVKSSKLKVVLYTLLAVVLVGAAGYGTYDWQHKKVTSATNEVSSLQSQINSLQTKVSGLSGQLTKAKAKATPATATVQIPQLGVQLSVPVAIKDLSFAVVSESAINGEATLAVNMSTTTLTTMDADCSAQGSSPPLGLLTKTDGQYPSNATVANSSGALVKQFSSYYIAYDSPQATCSSNSKTQTAAMADQQELKSALSSVSASTAQ